MPCHFIKASYATGDNVGNSDNVDNICTVILVKVAMCSNILVTYIGSSGNPNNSSKIHIDNGPLHGKMYKLYFILTVTHFQEVEMHTTSGCISATSYLATIVKIGHSLNATCMDYVSQYLIILM